MAFFIFSAVKGLGSPVSGPGLLSGRVTWTVAGPPQAVTATSDHDDVRLGREGAADSKHWQPGPLTAAPPGRPGSGPDPAGYRDGPGP